MNLVRATLAVLASTICASQAIAGHPPLRHKIIGAAHGFHVAAEHLSGTLSQNGYRHVARDAEELAAATHHFHEVSHGRGSGIHLWNDFCELQREFKHLKRALLRSHGSKKSEHIISDWMRTVVFVETIEIYMVTLYGYKNCY